MSEYEPIERKGNGSYSTQPMGREPSAPPEAEGRSYGGSPPHVLARMPDLDADEADMEPEMHRRHRRTSRKPQKSGLPVMLMVGGAVTLLALAAILFAVTRKGDSDSTLAHEEVAWQPEPSAANAPVAPPWGGAASDASNWQGRGAAPGYTTNDRYQNPSWNSSSQPPAWGGASATQSWSSQPASGWSGASPAAPAAASAWSGQDNHGNTPSWGSPSSSTSMATATPSRGMTNPSWGNASPTGSVTAGRDAATLPAAGSPSNWQGGAVMAAVPAQSAIPAWGEPAAGQQATAGSAGVTSNPYATGSSSAGPPLANEGYRASQPAVPYAGSYQPSPSGAYAPPPYGTNPAGTASGSMVPGQADYPGYGQPGDPAVYRADPSMGAPAVAQRYSYGAGPSQNGAAEYPRNDSAVYHSESSAGYGTSTDANNGAPGAYSAGYQGSTPANPPAGYPPVGGSAPVPGYGSGAAGYGTGAAAGYPQPGVAQLNGMIEKPTMGSNYDGARPGLY